MQLDKKTIELLLGMSDSQLKFLINKLADNAGFDLSSFNISTNDVSSIRQALSSATDADIAKFAEQLSHFKKRRER